MTKPRGRPPHPDQLTPAEWRVVEQVRHGMTNRDIALRQGVSASAVKFHVGNVLSKLGLATRKALRRWNGVSRGSALHEGERVMEAANSVGTIGQIARSTGDIEAARRFYGETLGLPHLYSFGKLAFYDCGGTRLMLSEGDGGPAESILYFRVADIHASRALLEAQGVAFVAAPHMIHRHEDGTEEWMAFFNDNEGRPLAIMAQARPSVA